MRSGLPLTELIEFTDGSPDGDITWELLDGTGATKTNGTVTPPAGSVSAVITVSGAENTIEAGGVSSPRELQWSYTVAGLIRSGRRRYRLEIFLPLGVSEDGVRTKLGVETHELEDEKIDLATAYSRFSETVGADKLSTVTGLAAQLAGHAIEALAALAILPSLQVSLAAKESSGTNQFQRTKIDWDALRAQLELYVSDGTVAVNAAVDPTANYGSIFTVVSRGDPLTGNDSAG